MNEHEIAEVLYTMLLCFFGWKVGEVIAWGLYLRREAKSQAEHDARNKEAGERIRAREAEVAAQIDGWITTFKNHDRTQGPLEITQEQARDLMVLAYSSTSTFCGLRWVFDEVRKKQIGEPFELLGCPCVRV